MASNPLTTNLYGPGMVGPNGVLSQPFVTFLKAVLAQAQATAELAAATSETETAAPVSITGQNGVQVFGSQESGFVVDGLPMQARIAARIAYGA